MNAARLLRKTFNEIFVRVAASLLDMAYCCSVRDCSLTPSVRQAARHPRRRKSQRIHSTPTAVDSDGHPPRQPALLPGGGVPDKTDRRPHSSLARTNISTCNDPRAPSISLPSRLYLWGCDCHLSTRFDELGLARFHQRLARQGFPLDGISQSHYKTARYWERETNATLDQAARKFTAEIRWGCFANSGAGAK